MLGKIEGVSDGFADILGTFEGELKALKTMKGNLKVLLMHLVHLKKSLKGNRMDYLMAHVYIHRMFVGNSHVFYLKLSKHFQVRHRFLHCLRKT